MVRPGGATAAAIAEAEGPGDDVVAARVESEDADANDDADDNDDAGDMLPLLFPPPFFLPEPPPLFPPLGMTATVSSCSGNKEQRNGRVARVETALSGKN